MVSSNVRSIGYEPGPDGGPGVLEVEFRNGGLFRYLEVPVAMYDALVAAPSIGAFLHGRIKPAFRCERVEVATP